MTHREPSRRPAAGRQQYGPSGFAPNARSAPSRANEALPLLQSISARRLVVAAAVVAIAATASAAEGPKIVGCRLGLGDQYKAGAWAPLWVSVEGGDTPVAVQVLAATPDGDGVGVGVFAPGRQPLSTEPGRVSRQRLYIRPGSSSPMVDVTLFAEGKRVDQRLFTYGDPDQVAAGEAINFGADSAGRLYLQLGGDAGLAEAVAAADSAYSYSAPTTTIVSDAADLPRDAIGYEAFRSVVLLAGRQAGSSGGGWLGDLTAGDPRIEALAEWVRGGGKLVLSCGSGGDALLGADGPLAPFVPGEYAGPANLTVATSLERYADAPPDAGSIDLERSVLTAAQLNGVQGDVEAFAGRTRDETPLIVRSPMGLGEVTFLAVDLDAPAISGWKGRPKLMQKLVGYTPPTGDEGYYYFQDEVESLVSVLDNSFAGVRTTPFLAIVGLVILYLLLIGPGDYFFVKKVLGRMEATWITFPLIVVATSAAAYAAAFWLKGNELRVNVVEITDVDCTTGRSRGVLVTHLFSPAASRYSLTVEPATLAGSPDPEASGPTGWLARSDNQFGGMSLTGVRPEYQVDPTPRLGPSGPPILGMPIQVWSTKTLLTRLTGQTDRRVESQLTPDGDALVEGSVTNDTGADLADCRLLYGDWAWELGDLADGETVVVDRERDPIKVSRLLGVAGRRGRGESENAIRQHAERLSIGSRATDATEPVSRYLPHLDLASHLEHGRALLLATVEQGARSELVRVDPATGQTSPLVDDESAENRRTWGFARFVLPVSETP